MFDIIKSGITPLEAEDLYPDNNIVLLYPSDGNIGRPGDVIYVGDVEGAFAFTDVKDPPDGFSYLMLRGNNLHEMVPFITEEPA